MLLAANLILEIPVYASNFAIGDLIEVSDTAGLKVRDSPAGNYITTESYGSRGIIRSGPRSASLGGVTYTWWYIEWRDGVKGWSAEGYPGGVYYIKKVPPEAPIALSPGSSSEPGPIIDTLTPTLQWQASFGADYYALAISEYPYGSSHIIYNPQQIYGTSHTVPAGVLQPGKKYRWNLQAHSSGGWSPISNTLYFQTSGESRAEIVSYYPSSKITVRVNQEFTLSVTFRNTGTSGTNFYAGATIFDSSGNQVQNLWSDKIYVSVGSQGYASWTTSIDKAGEYWLQFGIWDETKSKLLDRKPSPSQNLIRVEPLQTGKPDLTVIGQVSFTPSSVVRGQSLSVQFTVKNIGSMLSGNFYVKISLATTEYGTDYSLGNFQVSPLSPGESKPFSITTDPIPSSIPLGSYYVTAFVDVFKEIDESNEYNNIGSSAPNKVEVRMPTTTYDYTVSISGLGSGYSTKVYLDGAQKAILSNGQSYKFSGLTGSHTISVDSVVNNGAGVRYVCDSNSITISSSGSHAFSYKTQYYVTISVSPSGSGAVSLGSGWFDAGSSISISASPASGYRFKSWSTSGSITITNSGISSTTATINGPGSIIANFERVEQFDFSISISPSTRTIKVGKSTTYSITVSLLSGTTQTVTLSLSGQHSTMSYSLNPSSGSPTFTSTLTISTTGSTPANTYILTITGTGGGVTRQQQAILVVQSRTPTPTPPPAPVLKSPIDGSTVPSLTPRLEWYPSNGATSYWLQVSTDPTFTNLVINQPGITKTYYDIPSGKLELNTIYYWRVKASNAGGTSGWSNYWSFRTRACGQIMIKPVSGIVTQEFTATHPGMDIAAPKGTPIYAPFDGVVIEIRTGSYRGDNRAGGAGNYIVIRHESGVYNQYRGYCSLEVWTKYYHLDQVYVKPGQWVKQGQLIGTVGNTGKTIGPTGYHLHFEIRENGRYGRAVNPREYIRFGDGKDIW
jgi:VCBS repeat-containing protein